jgi:hypothetical protein
VTHWPTCACSAGYIDAFVMAVVLLLATPSRIITNRRLGGLAGVAVLLVVARRRILFE